MWYTKYQVPVSCSDREMSVSILRFRIFDVIDILWRDRLTYISPVREVVMHSVDLAVSRNHRQFGDYTK
jgi:hypothetical protein